MNGSYSFPPLKVSTECDAVVGAFHLLTSPLVSLVWWFGELEKKLILPNNTGIMTLQLVSLVARSGQIGKYAAENGATKTSTCF